MVFIEIEGEPLTVVWAPEMDGETIEGQVIKRKEADPEQELSSMYFLRLDNGEDRMVWGSYDLDMKMKKISDGAMVRIIYKGKKDIGKGKTLKIFKVMLDVPEPHDFVTTEEVYRMDVMGLKK